MRALLLRQAECHTKWQVQDHSCGPGYSPSLERCMRMRQLINLKDISDINSVCISSWLLVTASLNRYTQRTHLKWEKTKSGLLTPFPGKERSMEVQNNPLLKSPCSYVAQLLVCFGTGEAPTLRSPISICQDCCSTHHRRCSLHWTQAQRNSSRWCDPWRSASSEASLHSTASADCLLTWEQYLKLPCCHMVGTPCLQPCSLTPYLQRKCSKS